MKSSLSLTILSYKTLTIHRPKIYNKNVDDIIPLNNIDWRLVNFIDLFRFVGK